VTDLRTRYLGLDLRSPLVASAGPLTGDPDSWRRLEEAGAGAIVLPSLFEEEIERESFAIGAAYERGAESFGEASGFLPALDLPAVGPERHLEMVERARAVLEIPVIASLNGVSPGGWVRYARHLQSAGATAIERNLYDVVVDPRLDAATVEQRHLELVEEVRAEVTIPLSVKLAPWFTALGHLVARLEQVGVDGVVLFNRLYQPNIDLDSLEVVPRLSLSTAAEVRWPLHWIAALHGEVGLSLAASSGVQDGADVLKLLLVGADVVMSTSALLRHGAGHLATMERFVRAWMTERDYDSVAQLRGSVSRGNVADPQVYERAQYHRVLRSGGDGWHR